MIDVIHTKDSTRLRTKLRAVCDRNVSLNFELMGEVNEIVNDVRERGDAALLDYAKRFDGLEMRVDQLRVKKDQLRGIAGRVDGQVLAALRESINRVRVFHEHEQPISWTIDCPEGTRIGQRISPIDTLGTYVPGGTASYPSSVVMNVVPAQVAGVSRILVATPPRSLESNPAVAAALLELEVTEVYALGGAQAIAAMAFGTQTVPRVDKITGPGNQYVTAAKKLVFGTVGIDSLAGPSEVVIVADEAADPIFVASDLLAQAEHSEDASAILVTTSRVLAEQVVSEIGTQARDIPRVEIIRRSLKSYGTIILADNLDEVCDLVNEIAPEHLQIMAKEEDEIASRIRNVGAIFFGSHTPEAVGDYLAGPNHVLPTSGAARFSSALSVLDFVKRTSIVKFTDCELRSVAPLIVALAECEGLSAHARSASIRFRSRSDE